MIQINSVPKYGDRGDDVVKLQTALKSRGFSPGDIDGLFFGQTQAAISRLQKANKLTGTGVIGSITLTLLGLEVVTYHPVTGKATITKDLKGKLDRHLHPDMRLLLEAKVFPNGKISAAWTNKDITACFIEAHIGLSKLNIRESGGDNRGDLVGKVQGTTGAYTPGGNGDAWCLDYDQIPVALIEDFFGIESPIIANAHCMTTYRAALKVPGLVTSSCTAGTTALGKHGKTDSGHAMGVIEVLPKGKMKTSEGNTSVFDLRNGDGSGIKERDQKKNGDLVTQGFVFVYPNNKLPTVA